MYNDVLVIESMFHSQTWGPWGIEKNMRFLLSEYVFNLQAAPNPEDFFPETWRLELNMMFGFGRLSPSHFLSWNPIQKRGLGRRISSGNAHGTINYFPNHWTFSNSGVLSVYGLHVTRCGRRKSYVAWKVRRVEWDLKCVFVDFWEAKNGSVTIMNFKRILCRILANFMEFDVFFSWSLVRSLNQSSPPGGLSPMVSTCTPFLMALTCDFCRFVQSEAAIFEDKTHITAALVTILPWVCRENGTDDPATPWWPFRPFSDPYRTHPVDYSCIIKSWSGFMIHDISQHTSHWISILYIYIIHVSVYLYGGFQNGGTPKSSMASDGCSMASDLQVGPAMAWWTNWPQAGTWNTSGGEHH